MFRVWIAVVLGWCAGVAVAQELRVSLEPQVVYAGDRFRLTVEVAEDEVKNVSATFSKPVQRGGVSQNVQIFNGAMSQQLSVTYLPEEVGTYTLEQAVIETASGKTHRVVEPLSVEVKPIQPDPKVNFTVTVEPQVAYPGDVVTQTITLRTPCYRMQDETVSPFLERNIWGELTPRAPRLSFKEAEPSEALAPLGPLKQRSAEVEGDALVWVWELRYKAQRSGTYPLLTPLLNDTYVTKRTGGGLESHRVYTAAEPLPYEIKTPPHEDRPKGYIGAIGNTFEVRAKLSAHNVLVEDPVLLTLRIETDADPALLLAPPLPPLKGFRLAGEPKRDLHEGGCTFTYDLRPIEAGLLEIPSIDIAYFHRATEAYQTVATRVLPLHVAATQHALYLSTDTAPSADLPPLPLLMGESAPATTAPRPWALACLLVGGVALGIRLLSRPLKGIAKRLLAPIARRRPTAQALAMVRAAQTPAELAEALRFWAGRASLTATELRRLLPPSEGATALVEAYYAIEGALYGGTMELETVRAVLLATLGTVPRPRKSSMATRRMGLLLLLGMMPLLCGAATNPFLREQAAVATCAAEDAEDFARAANGWLQLLAEGDTSREVLLNGATCALFAHHPTTAQVLVARYERLYGRDEASVRQQQLVAEQCGAPLPWTYRLLAPHFAWSLARRAEGLCLLGGILLVLCAVPCGKLRKVRFVLALGVGVLGVSVLTSWVREVTFEVPAPLAEHLESRE